MSPVLDRGAGSTVDRARVRLGGLIGVGPGAVDGLDQLPWVDEQEALRAVLPPAVRGGRLALEPRAATVLAVVAAATVALAGWFAWRSAAVPGPAAPSTRVAGVVAAAASGPSTSGLASSATPSASAAGLVIDVAGRVRHPGLVHLPAGARVADALAAVGGALPGVDLTTVNLARALADGEQVVVGANGSAPAAGAASSGSAPDALVDLNTATLEQLDSLPGVGPVLAQRIADWRTQHGRFTSVDQLGVVGGIGPKKLGDIKPHVRV